jgi:predicted Mrr-cat superfamily restriction endonuclease
MARRIFAIITHHKLGNEVEAAELWKRQGICTFGWPNFNFCRYRSEEAIRECLKKENRDTRRTKEIWRFVREIKKGDLVLAYTRKNTIAYVGEVKGPCEFNTGNDVGNLEGKFYYPHQRKVKWWNEPHHFNRRDLPENFCDQLGKHGVIVAEIDPGSKGFEAFIEMIKVCASSGSKIAGINEDTVKAGLVKHLNHAIDRLEQGLIIKDAEIAIGKQKNLDQTS